MKKVILTLVLAFGMFAANAQVWIGGSTSVFAGKDHAKFTIAPEVGYSFPNTKWTIAIGANYAMDYTKYTDIFNNVHKDYTHNLILSPYVRYSICNIEKFAMFLDLTGDFDVLSEEFGYRVALQPGIAWMATKHWTAAFRFAFIGYNHCSYYNDLGYGDGFVMKFATAAPGFGLYYNF